MNELATVGEDDPAASSTVLNRQITEERPGSNNDGEANVSKPLDTVTNSSSATPMNHTAEDHILSNDSEKHDSDASSFAQPPVLVADIVVDDPTGVSEAQYQPSRPVVESVSEEKEASSIEGPCAKDDSGLSSCDTSPPIKAQTPDIGNAVLGSCQLAELSEATEHPVDDLENSTLQVSRETDGDQPAAGADTPPAETTNDGSLFFRIDVDFETSATTVVDVTRVVVNVGDEKEPATPNEPAKVEHSTPSSDPAFVDSGTDSVSRSGVDLGKKMEAEPTIVDEENEDIALELVPEFAKVEPPACNPCHDAGGGFRDLNIEPLMPGLGLQPTEVGQGVATKLPLINDTVHKPAELTVPNKYNRDDIAEELAGYGTGVSVFTTNSPGEILKDVASIHFLPPGSMKGLLDETGTGQATSGSMEKRLNIQGTAAPDSPCSEAAPEFTVAEHEVSATGATNALAITDNQNIELPEEGEWSGEGSKQNDDLLSPELIVPSSTGANVLVVTTADIEMPPSVETVPGAPIITAEIEIQAAPTPIDVRVGESQSAALHSFQSKGESNISTSRVEPEPAAEMALMGHSSSEKRDVSRAFVALAIADSLPFEFSNGTKLHENSQFPESGTNAVEISPGALQGYPRDGNTELSIAFSASRPCASESSGGGQRGSIQLLADPIGPARDSGSLLHCSSSKDSERSSSKDEMGEQYLDNPIPRSHSRCENPSLLGASTKNVNSPKRLTIPAVFTGDETKPDGRQASPPKSPKSKVTIPPAFSGGSNSAKSASPKAQSEVKMVSILPVLVSEPMTSATFEREASYAKELQAADALSRSIVETEAPVNAKQISNASGSDGISSKLQEKSPERSVATSKTAVLPVPTVSSGSTEWISENVDDSSSISSPSKEAGCAEVQQTPSSEFPSENTGRFYIPDALVELSIESHFDAGEKDPVQAGEEQDIPSDETVRPNKSPIRPDKSTSIPVFNGVSVDNFHDHDEGSSSIGSTTTASKKKVTIPAAFAVSSPERDKGILAQAHSLPTSKKLAIPAAFCSAKSTPSPSKAVEQFGAAVFTKRSHEESGSKTEPVVSPPETDSSPDRQRFREGNEKKERAQLLLEIERLDAKMAAAKLAVAVARMECESPPSGDSALFVDVDFSPEMTSLTTSPGVVDKRSDSVEARDGIAVTKKCDVPGVSVEYHKVMMPNQLLTSVVDESSPEHAEISPMNADEYSSLTHENASLGNAYSNDNAPTLEANVEALKSDSGGENAKITALSQPPTRVDSEHGSANEVCSPLVLLPDPSLQRSSMGEPLRLTEPKDTGTADCIPSPTNSECVESTCNSCSIF